MKDLWPHQLSGMAETRHRIAKGARRPMVCMPTGGGKTRFAAEIVKGALLKGNRVVFVVPAITLIDQTVEAFREAGITGIGVIQADHPATDPSQPVQVASVQTLARRKLPENVQLVINDEAHLSFKVIHQWMRERPHLLFIGLSATPWSRGLGKYYDELIVVTTTRELIDAGFLAPYVVYAPSHPDLSKVHTRAGDYAEDELADVMDQPALTADIVSTWMTLGENRPTLCFAVNRAHARSLEQQFERAGVTVAYVDAHTERDERTAIGEALAEGRVKVVVNVGCLTTGIDWDVRCIILARPTKSENLYVQIVGRGLRKPEGKTDCIILDHSDTTLRLGFVDSIGYDRLDDGKVREGHRKPTEKRAALPKECPSCHHVKAAGVHKCPKCGFAPVHREDIETRAGNLVQMTGGKRQPTKEEKQKFWSGLLWYVENRGKAEGWAAHRYKDRFDVWPRGLVAVAAEPDVHCRNWVRAGSIAFAKAKEKSAKEANLRAVRGAA